jgi:hypothetical protein
MTANCLARSLTGNNQSRHLSFDDRPLFVAVGEVVEDRTAAAAVVAVVHDDIGGLARELEEATELSNYLAVFESGMDDERVGGVVMAVFDVQAAAAEGGSIPAAAVEEVEHFAM